mgnify:CR=1 FL=1
MTMMIMWCDEDEYNDHDNDNDNNPTVSITTMWYENEDNDCIQINKEKNNTAIAEEMVPTLDI